MPITAGHYNIVLRGKQNSTEDHVNSFYVEVDLESGLGLGIEDEMFEIGKAFWNNIKAELAAVVTNAMTWNTLDVFKADGGDVGASGFYTIPDAERQNADAGDSLPPFVSYSFQYSRPNANFRHGYKRFGGVKETWNVNGVINSTGQTALLALANKLKADVPLGTGVGSAHMFPKLVQRIKNGIPVDPDVWYIPSTVVYKKLGSQNSRKAGVGS